MSFDFMSFDFDPIYLVWLFIAISAGLGANAAFAIAIWLG